MGVRLFLRKLHLQLKCNWFVALVAVYFALAGAYHMLGSMDSQLWTVFYYTVERIFVITLLIYISRYLNNTISIISAYGVAAYKVTLIFINILAAINSNDINEYLSYLDSFWASVAASIPMLLVLLLIRYLFTNRKLR